MTRTTVAVFVALVGIGGVAGEGVRAQETTLLAEEAAAIVPVDGKVRVLVRGIRGSIDIRKNETRGELRLLCYGADAKRELLPVAIWEDGSTLRIEPRAGSEAVGHALQIYLPERLDLRIETEGASVDLTELSGELEVRGRRLELVARAVLGGVRADLDGGSASFSSIGSSVDVQAREMRLDIRDVRGGVLLRQSGGEARIERVKGSTRAETENATLTIVEAPGVSVRSKRGKVALSAVVGADLSLNEAPLSLQRVRGELDIQTDAEVRFNDCQAALHIDGYGASVFGVHNDGLVEVKTHNAEVRLERIDGPLRVAGEGLKIRLQLLEGETLVYVRGSEVEVDGNKDHLVVDSAEGNVTVRQSVGPVEVRATGGTVRMLDLRGPADLRADAEDSEVSWAALPTDRDSYLENTGGDLSVRFPAVGTTRIEARTKSGRIEADLANISIDPSGTSASALIGIGTSRTIQIVSSWNIRLSGGPPRADARP